MNNSRVSTQPRLYVWADPNAKSDLDEEDAVELNSFTRKEWETGADFAVRVYDFVFRHKITSLLAGFVVCSHNYSLELRLT